MDDLKDLEEKYPELFNQDDDEVLLKLMQLILVKKGFKFIKNNLSPENHLSNHNLNPDINLLKEHSKEKFEEFNNLSSEEQKEVLEKIHSKNINPHLFTRHKVPEELKSTLIEHSKEKFEEFNNLSSEEKKEKLEKLQKSRERLGWGRNFFNMFRNGFNREINIDPGRLLGLTDGIFGMVITLLAFGIGLPEILISNEANFINFVYSLIPNIGVVLVSFIFVSSFWIYHHEFLNIKTLNLPFLWLHILFLACITFIPFTTSIIGTYSQFFLANVLFGINVFLTIVTFLLLYRYASVHDFLEERVSLNDKVYTYHTFFIIMALTIVVNLGDFLVSSNFIYLFFLVPVISTIRYILKD